MVDDELMATSESAAITTLRTVNLWVESIGNSSFVMGYEVVGDNAVVHAKVKSVQVAVSMETKKSRPLTEPEREFLTQYLKA